VAEFVKVLFHNCVQDGQSSSRAEATFKQVTVLSSSVDNESILACTAMNLTRVNSRVAKSEVKYPIPTLPKFPTPAFLKFPTP